MKLNKIKEWYKNHPKFMAVLIALGVILGMFFISLRFAQPDIEQPSIMIRNLILSRS